MNNKRLVAMAVRMTEGGSPAGYPLIPRLFSDALQIIGVSKVADVPEQEEERFVGMVAFQLLNSFDYFVSADDYRNAVDAIHCFRNGGNPGNMREYTKSQAYKLACQFSDMLGTEARILAKHYFRVALRGLNAGE